MHLVFTRHYITIRIQHGKHVIDKKDDFGIQGHLEMKKSRGIVIQFLTPKILRKEKQLCSLPKESI